MDPDVGPGYFFKHPSLEMPIFCDLEPCIRDNCGWVGNPAPKGWLKPYKQWDKAAIDWCKISSIHCSLV